MVKKSVFYQLQHSQFSDSSTFKRSPVHEGGRDHEQKPVILDNMSSHQPLKYGVRSFWGRLGYNC